MALIASDLRDEIDAQLSSKIGAPYDALDDQIKNGFLDALATGFTLWVTGGTGLSGPLPGADVATTVTVTSVSGVTAGAAASGPGTGSGTGGLA